MLLCSDGQSPPVSVDVWSLAAVVVAVAVSVSLVPSDSSVVVAAAVVASSVEASVAAVVSVVDSVVLVVSVAAFAVAADMIAPPPKPATAPNASVPGINSSFLIFTKRRPFVVLALMSARMCLSCARKLGWG